MTRSRIATLVLLPVLASMLSDLPVGLRQSCQAQEKQTSIDFEKARSLLQRSERGEKLSKDESEYLRQAKAARERMNRSQGLAPRESVGLKPLTEMTADDRYQGEDGGLYGHGMNTPPALHLSAALAALAIVRPLDGNGQPDSNGKIAFVSISMSNATQEFSRFKRLADADSERSKDLIIIDCAQGGQAMAEWVSSNAPPWREADRRIKSAGVTPAQVQVAWIKLANKGPTGTLAEHGRKLLNDTQTVIQNAKSRFPNLQIAYLSSRIYGGYATNRLNPEPYAYESAFAVRWLIQEQIAGKPELNYDRTRSAVKAPVLLWGPYLWADGTTPRKSDGLTYARGDLMEDGTHPSEIGRDKVARLMLSFYKSEPLSKSWFIGRD